MAASLQYDLPLQRTFMDYELKVENVNGMDNMRVFSYLIINHKLAADLIPEGFFDFDSLHTQLDLMPDRDTWVVFRSSGEVDAPF